MRKIVNLYLSKEILGPFFLGLLTFTFILLMHRILKLMELVINKEVPLVEVLKLIIYILPYFLVFTIPMAILLSTLLALGRLSTDQEIIGMKASGISLYQLVPPIITISLIASLLTTFISVYALPWGRYSFKKNLFEIAKKRADIGIKERVFNNDFEGLTLYVEEIPVGDQKLKGILISDKRELEEPSTIVAKEGYIFSAPDSLTLTLRLFEGSIHRTSKDLKAYQKIDFKIYDLNLTIANDSSKRGIFTKGHKEMTIRELREEIKGFKAKNLNPNPLWVELHKKFSLPFACLVFGLMGIPLGVQTKKGGKSRGFVISLVIVLVYYIFLTWGEALGEKGKIFPSLAIWFPNLLLGTLGVYLLIKGANESPVKALVWLNQFWESIGERIKKFFSRL